MPEGKYRHGRKFVRFFIVQLLYLLAAALSLEPSTLPLQLDMEHNSWDSLPKQRLLFVAVGQEIPLVCWLIDLFIDWLIDLFIDLFTYWLIYWLIHSFPDRLQSIEHWPNGCNLHKSRYGQCCHQGYGIRPTIKITNWTNRWGEGG